MNGRCKIVYPFDTETCIALVQVSEECANKIHVLFNSDSFVPSRPSIVLSGKPGDEATASDCWGTNGSGWGTCPSVP